jgi:hypothetical protein
MDEVPVDLSKKVKLLVQRRRNLELGSMKFGVIGLFQGIKTWPVPYFFEGANSRHSCDH